MPVVEALRRAGVPVWPDQQGISGGENYALEITEAIARSAALLMCSAASLASRNVKQEIALAWKFERPYVPLLLEAVIIPKDVMYWLEAAQWIEMLDKPDRDWLPQVLAALAPFGIAPTPEEQEHVQLAGREKELALLREKLAAAKEGKGQAGADALDALSPAERVGSAEPDGADATVMEPTRLSIAGPSSCGSPMLDASPEAEAMAERYITETSADTASGIAGALFADA